MLKKILILGSILTSIASAQYINNLTLDGEYILKSDKHLVHNIEPIAEDGKVNILVEIPAGTNGKWEVNKTTGNLEWEFKNGQPRIVKYLPYIGNYGMIPQTLLSKQEGGDGDPLDVILLGESVARGEVIKGRLIGVMLMKDGGEIDDKLLAVAEGSIFDEVSSIEEINEKFPGALTILKTWFTNYKGKDGKIVIEGFSDSKEANRILKNAIAGYKKYNR